MDDAHAEQLHGFIHGIDLAAETEERGVGNLQELGGKRRVLGRDFGDAVGRGQWRLQGLGDLEIKLGDAGQAGHAAGDGAQFIVSELLLDARDFFEARLQVIEAAGLGEKLVGEADATDDLAQVRIAGEDDAYGLRVVAQDVVEQLRAVDTGHAHVSDDDVKFFLFNELTGGLAALGELHVPFAGHGAHAHLQHADHRRFVIHKKDPDPG